MAGHALYFHCARGLSTRELATLSDSLVRVSRRVGCARSVSRHLGLAAAQGSPKPLPEKCDESTVADDPCRQSAPRATANGPCGPEKAHARLSRRHEAGRKRVSSCRFQALFNSLFKVLCIFPSRYLFAIGHEPIFSFRWNLPPTSSCNPKQPDSARAHRAAANRHGTGFSPSPIPRSKGFERRTRPMAPF